MFLLSPTISMHIANAIQRWKGKMRTLGKQCIALPKLPSQSSHCNEKGKLHFGKSEKSANYSPKLPSSV